MVGMITSSDPIEFAKLSWFNLVISAIVLLINLEEWNKKLVLVLFMIGVLGFAVEVIGVKSGVIFGSYSYGESLGLKLFEVPLVISLNWIMLTFISVFSVRQFIDSKILISLISALILVVLDVLIEPIAIRLDFWNWTHGTIPIQNYLAWFIIAIIFTSSITYSLGKSVNNLALFLLIMQFLFFTVLNLGL